MVVFPVPTAPFIAVMTGRDSATDSLIDCICIILDMAAFLTPFAIPTNITMAVPTTPILVKKTMTSTTNDAINVGNQAKSKVKNVIDQKTFDKLNREAKKQRQREGYPTVDLKKVIAAMTPEQKKQFWNMVNGKRTERMTVEL